MNSIIGNINFFSFFIMNSTDKNGKAFLKVKVLNGGVINCFKVEPKKAGD